MGGRVHIKCKFKHKSFWQTQMERKLCQVFVKKVKTQTTPTQRTRKVSRTHLWTSRSEKLTCARMGSFLARDVPSDVLVIVEDAQHETMDVYAVFFFLFCFGVFFMQTQYTAYICTMSYWLNNVSTWAWKTGVHCVQLGENYTQFVRRTFRYFA